MPIESLEWDGPGTRGVCTGQGVVGRRSGCRLPVLRLRDGCVLRLLMGDRVRGDAWALGAHASAAPTRDARARGARGAWREGEGDAHGGRKKWTAGESLDEPPKLFLHS